MALAGELSLLTGDDEPRIPPGRHPHGDGVNTLVDLYRNHQQRIYRYCLALLRNPDDAEDATQETFTRAAPFLPNLPGDLSAYLTTVARNICCDVVRARSRRVVPIDNVPLTDRRVGPERQNVDWDVVRRMWRQLSPSERLLFAYTFAGYKYEEIASRTGMSRPSVSVGLTRARRRLRDLAAATGTLGLLPLGIRRLLDRAGRRVSLALNSTQAVVVGTIDQAGAVVVGLLGGLFAVAAATPASMPPMMAAGVRHAPPVMTSDPAYQAAAPVAAVSSARSAGQAPAASSGKPTGSRPSTALPPAVASGVPGSQLPLDAANVYSMTPSPNYPSDHTVYVTGDGYGDNCAATTLAPNCQALYRTADDGASWTRLSLATFTGGAVLLPPAYPTDPAFFVLEANEQLQESTTGDGTFTWRVPGVVTAAIAPWSAPGHAQIAVVVGPAIQFYGEGDTTAQPGPALPAGFVPMSMAWSAPGQVIVAGYVVTPNLAGGTGAVTVCTQTCAQPALFTDTPSGPTLAVSPDVATDHLVLAIGTTVARLSRDGGATFQPIFTTPSNSDLQVATLGRGPLGPRILLSYSAANRPVAVMSDNLGANFGDITGNLDATGVLAGVAAYPDGTVLAGILGTAANNHFALRQTSGNGTWINPS